MYWLLFTLALPLALAPQMSRAQGDAPPVLDPADVFTDAVEVVETLPILNADNDARMLWYFDPEAGEWRGYAYPDRLDTVNGMTGLPDGGIYLLFNTGSFDASRAADYWAFDPVSEQFLTPEVACNGLRDGPRRWALYQHPDSHLYHLCFTATNELTPPLPQSLQSNLCDREFLNSPPRQWVVMAVCDQPDRNTLYGYYIESGRVVRLGDIEGSDALFLQWINETTLTLFSVVGDEHRIYRANVTRPDSLELIAAQVNAWPQYYPDPARYVWIADGDIHETVLETGETTVLMEANCLPAETVCIAAPNGIADQTTLVAVIKELHSEDGVGYPPDSITIYDRLSGENVFSGAFDGNFGFARQNPVLEWLDRRSFLLFNSRTAPGASLYYAHLVTLDESGASETTIEYVYGGRAALSPNERRLLMWSESPEVTHGMSVYDIAARRATPIIRHLDAEDFWVSIAWHGDDLLEVWLIDRDYGDSFVTGRWRVRLRSRDGGESQI